MDFEGTIPKSMYGAGKVEIWDKGTYVLKNREAKKIEFTLYGIRLRRDHTLIRFKNNQWLFLGRGRARMVTCLTMMAMAPLRNSCRLFSSEAMDSNKNFTFSFRALSSFYPIQL